MSPTKEREKKPLFKRRWVLISVALIVLLPVVYTLSVFGAKSYLINFFLKNGADKATIEKLWLNPFSGRLDVKGLDVEKDGKTMMKHSDLTVDIGWGAIFNKDIKVQDAQYSDLILDIEQYDDGSLRIGSYTLPQGDGTAKPAETAVSENVASAWAFLADFVHLTNCRVKLKTPELEFALQIDELKLNKFTTREGKRGATLTLAGSLNGESLSLDIEKLHIAPSLELEGRVELDRFKLGELAKLLQDALPVFSGDAGISGDVKMKMGEGDTGEITVGYNGTIVLKSPEIGSSSFNTKAGKFSWEGKVDYVSAQTNPMTIVTDGTLSATQYEIIVPDAAFSTSESKIELRGKNSVTIADNVMVNNSGSLGIENIALALPGNEVAEEKLSWKGDVQYDSNKSGGGQYVATDGLLTLGPLDVATGVPESPVMVASDELSWSGNIVYGQQQGRNNSHLGLKGVLGCQKIKTELGGPGLLLEQGAVKLNTATELVFGEKVDVQGTNSLHLGDFSFQGGENIPKVKLAQLSLKDLQGLGGKKLRLKELISKGLEVNVSGAMPLDIDVPEINLGQFATDDLANFDLGKLTMQAPHIVAVENGKEMLRLKDIAVAELRLNEAINVTAGDVNLNDLTFLAGSEDGSENPFLTLKNAKLSKIAWGMESGFSGETLYFDQLVTNIIRDKEGAINISKRLAAMQVGGAVDEKEKGSAEAKTAAEVYEKDGETEKVVAQQPEEGTGAKIRLGEVAIKDNSKIHFEDHTLAVPYITDLTIDTMELKNLDSTKPEAKSPYVLKATLEERAPISVNGSVSPFLTPVAVGMDMKLKNYPLSRLSAYTVQAVGTALASGQLNLTTKMDLSGDKLDMKNKVELKKLETEMISKELAAELDNQLPIPLDTALSILRDSDENISLDIPIKGPLSDLSVGVADVLITALSKAIIPAASAYMMYALGPYGAIAYAGMKVGEEMMKLKLPPVIFEPGSVEISDDQKKYLGKFADIMKGRPEADFQLCPVVGSWELRDAENLAAVEGEGVEVAEEEQQPLIDLGQERAKAVQEFLSSSYGIDAARLFISETKIDNLKKVQPAVLLQL